MRKIFTFLFAALMSVSMFAATTVTWNTNDITGSGKSFTKDGVTITVAYDINFEQKNFEGGGTFTTTLGNFTKIEVTADDVYTVSGDGWSGDIAKKTWTGNASSVSFTDNIYGNGGDITFVFTIEASAPTTYTLQLVADPEKGSVEVTNLLGSDIIDNGNGNYTVPENAEVTILATPLEGYEFTGWKVGNIEEMVGCYYCGTAVNTEDNPYTFTMTADVAYKAEFEAEAPQVERELTKLGFNFPSENIPADNDIEMAGTFEEGTMWMEKIIATGWFVSYDFVNAAEDETFKLRSKSNNDLVLCQFIPANDGEGGKWVQAIFTFGNYWSDDTWKGTPCKLIEEDLSDAAQYAWMEGMPEPEPEPEPVEATVVFAANGNTKEVTVTLPHTFWCDLEDENGELDGIIQELYALPQGGYCDFFTEPVATGNAAVTAGEDDDANHFITISEAFEGTARVSGKYYKYIDLDEEIFNYSLTISIKGDEPTAISNTAVEAKAVKRIVNGQLLIIRDGKMFNLQGAEVK